METHLENQQICLEIQEERKPVTQACGRTDLKVRQISGGFERIRSRRS